ncbi:aldo/keto reductase [Microbacterium sp. DT81.1]|uniref:aldo/keto reductase n=1 Tax=Microbacterium sp. DT81.1 TaxID=3393413 RepID=UPI003CF95B5E
MQQRILGRTGRNVSAIGLGTWQLGADWGDVSEEDARAILTASVDAGVTLFDTADVYGDGRSEKLIGGFLAERAEAGVFVATKMGRREAQLPENYAAENFRLWTDRSRANLGVDTLDLVQLHCPPSEVIEADATYDALDALVADGSIAAYGVSVETCAQALSAIARPGVASIQIILNPFRLKPLDEVLPAAEAAGVGILARVPLASGLLSGRYTADTTFAADDHRSYNRHGEAFDRGETFSGVDFEVGIEAARELAAAVPEGVSLPAASLAWVASRPGVTTVIPGARTVAQGVSNADAAALLDADAEDRPFEDLGFDVGGFDVEAFADVVRDVYDRRLRADIHPLW